MTMFRRIALPVISLLLLFCLSLQAADKKSAKDGQSFSGTVTDMMCGAKHAMAGKSDADCTRACVKEGSEYGLVVGDKVYTLKGDKAQLDKLAGQKVKVTGTLSGTTITASSIAAGS